MEIEERCIYFHPAKDIAGAAKGDCSYEPGVCMTCFGRCRAYKTKKELCNVAAAKTHYAIPKQLWDIWQAFLCSQYPDWRELPSKAPSGEASTD